MRKSDTYIFIISLKDCGKVPKNSRKSKFADGKKYEDIGKKF